VNSHPCLTHTHTQACTMISLWKRVCVILKVWFTGAGSIAAHLCQVNRAKPGLQNCCSFTKTHGSQFPNLNTQLSTAIYISRPLPNDRSVLAKNTHFHRIRLPDWYVVRITPVCHFAWHLWRINQVSRKNGIYSLYCIKINISLESPHKTWKPNITCVCLCVWLPRSVFCDLLVYKTSLSPKPPVSSP